MADEIYTPNNLLGGSFPQACKSVTILAGQSLAAGAVLGKITASGKYTLVDKAAVDGSQTPVAVLKEAVDATLADTSGIAAETGEFNIAAISLAAGTVAADVIDALAARNIYLRTLS